MNSTKAFTLIELSIVLVIIGLVSAGVLVGRDLIRGFEVRSQVAQIESYNSAVYAFKNKYNCLPGDCAKAEELDLGLNGNGNDEIDNTFYPNADSPETIDFWLHLSNAELVEGFTPYTGPAGNGTAIPGIHSPALKMPGNGSTIGTLNPELSNTKGGWWFAHSYLLGHFYQEFRNAWIFTASTRGSNPSGLYLPQDMFMLDSKIDDGFPISGSIRSFTGTIVGGCFFVGGTPYPMCAGPSGITTSTGFADACVNDSPPHDETPVYQVTSITPSESSLCSPIIRTPF
jgi:prepilin-type N-terminal cleavage/methylation domain-containing protein